MEGDFHVLVSCTCSYWFTCSINIAIWYVLQALVYSDADGIKENCVKLGAGDDLYALFAGILTMRPWNKVIDPSVDHLVVKGTDSDRSELQVTYSMTVWS